jgi:hypothetical protein
MGGVGAVAGRRDGARRLCLAAHLLVCGVDRLDDRVEGHLERRHVTRPVAVSITTRLEAGWRRSSASSSARKSAAPFVAPAHSVLSPDLHVVGDLGWPPFVQLLAKGAMHHSDMDAADLLVLG